MARKCRRRDDETALIDVVWKRVPSQLTKSVETMSRVRDPPQILNMFHINLCAGNDGTLLKVSCQKSACFNEPTYIMNSGRVLGETCLGLWKLKETEHFSRHFKMRRKAVAKCEKAFKGKIFYMR
jgi:hypothetical protein